jgi:hypothetical protein
MQAIDEVDRIKREGTLTYYRHHGARVALDTDVVESIEIILKTPNDPSARCLEVVQIEWLPHFANGALAPRVKANAGGAKMLALFPEILAPFYSMQHGELTPEAFIEGLLKVGVSPAPRRLPYEALSITCVCCRSLFDNRHCSTYDNEMGGFCCDWCSVSARADMRMDGRPS